MNKKVKSEQRCLLWQKLMLLHCVQRAVPQPVCSSSSSSASGTGQALRFTRVHLPALCCRTAAAAAARVCWSSSSLSTRMSDLTPTLPPAPGRPACWLIHTAPIDFAAADPPAAAFLSWQRHSSTSKLGPPLDTENSMTPRACRLLLCPYDAFFRKSNLQ